MRRCTASISAMSSLPAASGSPARAFLREVALPGALPGFFTGLRLAVTTCWTALVVLEQINTTEGIGYLMSRARDYGQTDVIVVGLAIYAILGLGSDFAVRFWERKALSYRKALAHDRLGPPAQPAAGRCAGRRQPARPHARASRARGVLERCLARVRRRASSSRSSARAAPGKSTLLRAIAGLDDGVEGEGRISVPADRSVLFQDSRLLPWKNCAAERRLRPARRGCR